MGIEIHYQKEIITGRQFVNQSLYEGMSKLLNLKGKCHLEAVKGCEANQLTLTQLSYLSEINKIQMTTTSELSEQLSLTKPTVTEAIKKLEKNGFIQKHKCIDDGRVTYLTLSEKGKQIANIDQTSLEKLVSTLESRLSDQQLDSLIEILRSL